jgi:hypothetical protein
MSRKMERSKGYIKVSERGCTVMFDPTAYENLKVVLQGALYELELTGALKVLSRQDVIDLASLERKFSLALCNPAKTEVTVKVILSAGIKEWSAEALPKSGSEPGAMLQIIYQSEGSRFKETFITNLEGWWGPRRTIEWREISSTLESFRHQGIISFNRLITEDMVDELEEVVVHIENSLVELV